MDPLVLWLVFASVLLTIAVVLGLVNPQQGKKVPPKTKVPKSKQKENEQNLQNSLQLRQTPQSEQSDNINTKSTVPQNKPSKDSEAQKLPKGRPEGQRNRKLDRIKNIDKPEQQKRDDSASKSESENELQLLNWTKDALEDSNHDEVPLDNLSPPEKRMSEDEWRSKKSVEELLKKRTLELEKDLVKAQRQAEKFANKVKELKIVNAKLSKQKNQIEHEFVQKIVKLEKQLGRYDAVVTNDTSDILKGMNYVHRNPSRNQNSAINNENTQPTNGSVGNREEVVVEAVDPKQPRKPNNRQYFKRRPRGSSGRKEDAVNPSGPAEVIALPSAVENQDQHSVK